MIDNYTFSMADETDYPAIRELLKKNDLPYEDLGGHVQLVLIKQTGSLVAIAGAEIYSPYALLRSVVVDDKYKGQGLGLRLTVYMLDFFAANGIGTVYLLTTTAAPFFAKLGFAETDRAGVPSAIAATKEFSDICPSSSTCMSYPVF